MKTSTLLLFFFLTLAVKGQHTFSIVAVDTITGEVGGAGATCYAVVNDIADVHPGVGFIHTQSYVDYDNQAYARTLMDRGFLPQEIMDSLAAHDISSQPQLRQYAAVTLSGPHSAAFTGTSCYTYRGQRLGSTYAIAGNILKGAMVLDSMEACFNRTQGSLSDKLMAALQGAKIIGADKRCVNDGVSSLSAYMIVAKPTDVKPNYYINLNVENVWPLDPIDTLQTLYNNLFVTGNTGLYNKKTEDALVFPNPAKDRLHIRASEKFSEIELYNLSGVNVLSCHQNLSNSTEIDISGLPCGYYTCTIIHQDGKHTVKKIIKEK